MLDKVNNLDLGLDARNKINLAFDTIDALMLASASSSGFSEDILYADLLNLANTSALEAGKAYVITDFATYHIIPNTSGATNLGATEPLVVKAISVSQIDKVATSLTYPKDIIHYELVDSSLSGGTKGRIIYRMDPIYNNATHYDWRNVKFRRWASSQVLTKSGGSSLSGSTGSYVTGSISGATGYAISSTGTNTVRVFPLTGAFQVGDILTLSNGAVTGAVTTVTDFRFERLTDNGRAYQDYYTFNNSATANFCRDNYIAPREDFSQTYIGNNVVFITSSIGNKLNGNNIYDCTFYQATSNIINDTFYNNIFTGPFQRNTINGSFYNNIMHGVYSNSILSGFVSSNIIYQSFTTNLITNESSVSSCTFFAIIGNQFTKSLTSCFSTAHSSWIIDCDFRSAVSGLDFTTSTIIYGGYPKIIINDLNIIYWDNTGVQQVAFITT